MEMLFFADFFSKFDPEALVYANFLFANARAISSHPVKAVGGDSS
jgi:hypothetical protein